MDAQGHMRHANFVLQSLPSFYRKNMKKHKLYFIGRFFVTICIAGFVVEFEADPEVAIYVLGALWLAPETAEAMVQARQQASQPGSE